MSASEPMTAPVPGVPTGTSGAVDVTPAVHARNVRFGIWVFLCSESLFFAALFVGWSIMRFRFPEAFIAASDQAEKTIGTLNTILLLTSSFTMWTATRAAHLGRARDASRALFATAILGIMFLALKGFEYYLDYQSNLIPAWNFDQGPLPVGPAEVFWLLYFIMTGIHAIHLTLGVIFVFWTRKKVDRGELDLKNESMLSVVGIYWSYVDVIWLLFYPLIYLSGTG